MQLCARESEDSCNGAHPLFTTSQFPARADDNIVWSGEQFAEMQKAVVEGSIPPKYERGGNQ